MFEQVMDGEWVEPMPQDGHLMACCDCGLVHRVNFRVGDGGAQFQAFRDDEATEQRRATVSHPFDERAAVLLELKFTACAELGVGAEGVRVHDDAAECVRAIVEMAREQVSAVSPAGGRGNVVPTPEAAPRAASTDPQARQFTSSAPPGATPGWQPIETAPKDGSDLLLYDADTDINNHWPVIGHYVDFESVGGAPDGYHSGWFDNLHGHTEWHPTHWMPLPAVPASTKE